MGPGSTRSLPLGGNFGVPADATAVVLNVTAVRSTSSGYLTVFPAGTARPFASSVNFTAGAVVANSVTVGLGAGGAVAIFNSAGITNVAVDVLGWYGPSAADGLALVSPTVRAVDTRSTASARIKPPGGAFGGAEVLSVKFAGNPALPEVPATATAVVLNVTVTRPTVNSHLTVWPSGGAKPGVSNINFDPGQTIANLVVATSVGDGGSVELRGGPRPHRRVDRCPRLLRHGRAGEVRCPPSRHPESPTR